MTTGLSLNIQLIAFTISIKKLHHSDGMSLAKTVSYLNYCMFLKVYRQRLMRVKLREWVLEVFYTEDFVCIQKYIDSWGESFNASLFLEYTWLVRIAFAQLHLMNTLEKAMGRKQHQHTTKHLV